LFCSVSFCPPFSCLLVCRNNCFCFPVLHTRLAVFQSLRPCLFFLLVVGLHSDVSLVLRFFSDLL
jgi:hypothetical protein